LKRLSWHIDLDHRAPAESQDACSNADLRGVYSFVLSGTFRTSPLAAAGQTAAHVGEVNLEDDLKFPDRSVTECIGSLRRILKSNLFFTIDRGQNVLGYEFFLDLVEHGVGVIARVDSDDEAEIGDTHDQLSPIAASKKGAHRLIFVRIGDAPPQVPVLQLAELLQGDVARRAHSGLTILCPFHDPPLSMT